MGEEEEKPKKVDEAPVVVVAAPPIPPPEGVEMKMFLHCEGCARKVRKSLKGFNGVEEVKTDCRTHKVFVKGKGAAEDPMKVVERVEAKTGRKVELVSLLSPPNALKKKEERKEEVEIVAVMKVHMHCEACAQEIKKRILRTKGISGVESVETDRNASRVTVKGVFDPPKLVEYLHKRTGKRAVIINVEPVENKCKDNKPKEEEKEKNEEKKAEEEKEDHDKAKKEDEEQKKDADEVQEDDKSKEEEKGDDEKKEGDKAEEEKADEEGFDNVNEDKEKKEGDKAEDEKANEEDLGNENVDKEKKELSAEEMEVVAAKIEQKRNEFFYYYPVTDCSYSQHIQHLVYEPHPQVLYNPQMFSDENPNACSIM